MYGNDDHMYMGYSYMDQLPALNLAAADSNISPQLITNYSRGDGIETMGYNTLSSGEGSVPTCYMSSTELTPTSVIPRSLSSHSLQKNTNVRSNSWFNRMGIVSESESDSNPVRRVFSTGDLQKINALQRQSRPESPLSSESNSIIESMSRAYPYSPEEKKERIERYKSKRSQRNFTKKIKYECRKTLADSRPRVRGRFAKNDEIENSTQSSQWSQDWVGYNEENDNWLNFLDSFSESLIP